MEGMSKEAQEENEAKCQAAIKNRLDAIEQELHQGWIIYGRFMDTKRTGEQIAIDVREVIRLLTEEKSKLIDMLKPKEAIEFIGKHKELLNGKG
jgi:hypothetical protein